MKTGIGWQRWQTLGTTLAERPWPEEEGEGITPTALEAWARALAMPLGVSANGSACVLFAVGGYDHRSQRWCLGLYAVHAARVPAWVRAAAEELLAADNVIELADDERLVVSDHEEEKIAAWLLGAFQPFGARPRSTDAIPDLRAHELAPEDRIGAVEQIITMRFERSMSTPTGQDIPRGFTPS